MSGTDAVDLACELVRLDTRGGGESAAAALLAGHLEDAGLSVAVHETRPGRANVVARHGDETPVTLTGHLDTVPADEAVWSFDPLAGDVVDGRLRGRGSSDMKAGVAAAVVAAAEHVRAGGRGVQVVLTFGEETGCEGAREIPSDALTPSGTLLVAEPTSNRVVLGHKGVLWLVLRARGVPAHGSRPDLGHNALVDLARAAVRIHEHDGWPTSRTHGATTANVGMMRAGIQPNVVPDRAALTVDLRLVPGDTADAAEATTVGLAGCPVETERLVELPLIDTDPARVTRTVELLGGGTPSYATYFTDASVLAPALGGADTIVFGPGEPEQAHVTDETAPAGLIGPAAEAYRAVLGALT
ncbi:M20 family metallopeptidase [Actinomycetospora callitridis]|uniref:M20 family metallopeptidase n=1 Tax=Actinomycetospora callitridis TaxID=913944 RepID=UPI0023669DE6|nr:M20/M25/M40 family metallo-hydrolase [Actinomycetospora callitridis]MDD7921850.1 M20/M25/M40 family metallo-hydrolase [Actinomycetospora callitridis]